MQDHTVIAYCIYLLYVAANLCKYSTFLKSSGLQLRINENVLPETAKL